ncbi:MAG: DNA polymerase III subunit delta [Paludibacteraceae bacterium]|nr:DNA polymerase III subunit delta [Paludibacteraceae bacterium]MBP5136151.1 DNA polymerase III subunit delta [Paludibacteraceae bacterium]
MAKELTYDDILTQLKNKEYKPVYLLMGEEAYYIDLISDYIQENVLDPSAKDFDLTVVYGHQTTQQQVAMMAKRFPMMGMQVIIVKEAQNLFSKRDMADDSEGDNANALALYLQNPQPTTILVLCYKYGKLDKRKKLYTEISKIGVVLDSQPVRDYQLPKWIISYVKKIGLTIDDRSAHVLAEYIGSDLQRIASSLDKLKLSMPAGSTAVTAELIERNIGISKDYNNFELQNALMRKDILRVNRIGMYFGQNQKANPIFPTISVLFNLFFNLLLVHYSTNRNEYELAKRIGVMPFFVKDYVAATKLYNARKCMENISILKEYDEKCKGGGSKSDASELLMEMLFRLMH